MARTEYTKANGAFSDRAHEAAQDLLYPAIFNTERFNLEFESTMLNDGDHNTLLDGQMGIDRLVKVTVKSLPAPIEFAIQERFRRPEFMRYQDLTVTEWNHSSNLPSELYKIKAGLFLYGYYDEIKHLFGDAICVNVEGLKYALVTSNIIYERRRNPKRQSFLCFKFTHLTQAGIVIYRESKSYATTTD
jgi:hypothetical protein